MKTKLFLCIIISLASLSGCKDNSPTGPDKPDVPFSDGIMPLKAGYRWTYRWYVLDGITGEVKREYPGSHQMQLIPEYIKGNYKGNSYDGFAWDTQYIGEEHEPIVKWLYMNRPDGLYQIGGISKTDTSMNNLLHYKYPVKIGESWLVPRLVYDDMYDKKFFINDSARYECTDTAAVFQTPVGDFKCYVYSHLVDLGDDIASDEEYFEYFKPGFGLVGIVVKDYSPRTGKRSYKFKMVLQSFDLY